MAQAWVRAQLYKKTDPYTKNDLGGDVSIPLRELIAATVLHGLTTRTYLVSPNAESDRELIERMADRAVVAADALIARLAKE